MAKTVFAGLLAPAVVVAVAVASGCAAGVVAGGAAAGVAAYDRRTTGTLVDDQSVEFKALNAVRNDEELWNNSHVNVTSYNGIVLLSGETTTEDFRVRIERLVADVPKVRHIHNELAVSAPSAMLSRSSDTWITGKVKSALVGAEGVSAARVKVVTENGVVYLMGLVTRAESEQATDVTRRVAGVQRVVKLFEYLD